MPVMPAIIVHGEVESPNGWTSFAVNAETANGLAAALGEFLFGPKETRVEGADGEGRKGYRMLPGFLEFCPVVPFEVMTVIDRVMEGEDIEVRFDEEGERKIIFSSVAPDAGGGLAALIRFEGETDLVSIVKTSADDLSNFLENLFLQSEGHDEGMVENVLPDPLHRMNAVYMIQQMLGDFHRDGDSQAKFECEELGDTGVRLEVYLVRE